MKVYENVQAPSVQRGGRPSTTNFSSIAVGGAGYLPIPEGLAHDKALDRVKGQVARWRKADESRKNMKFTVALGVPPDDALGTQHVGVFRTA